MLGRQRRRPARAIRADAARRRQRSGATAVAMSGPAAFAVDATERCSPGAPTRSCSDAIRRSRSTGRRGRVEASPARLADRRVGAARRARSTSEGQLYCWGHGEDGALGLGSIPHRLRSRRRCSSPAPHGLLQVAVAQTHSCVRMTDGALSVLGARERVRRARLRRRDRRVHSDARSPSDEERRRRRRRAPDSTCALVDGRKRVSAGETTLTASSVSGGVTPSATRPRTQVVFP